jgi:Mg2+ and Co2+ transporter CorA
MDMLPGGPPTSGSSPEPDGLFQSFSEVDAFAEAIKAKYDLEFDLDALLELNTNFSQITSQYLLLNIKEFSGEKPDNLLFLTEDRVFFCSRNVPSEAIVETFDDVIQKPFGKSTIVTFLVLNQILDKHIQQLEFFGRRTRKLETDFIHDEYRILIMELERYSDVLEEFHDLIIALQERRYKQVETQYIAFDYRVLIAESQSLQARCRRRLSYLKDLRQDHELKSTEELNQKIVRMNDILKKLTSITVILMLPTLIASHFGMNFYHMPELRIWWVYPAVILAQIVIMAVFFVIFRKIDWL